MTKDRGPAVDAKLEKSAVPAAETPLTHELTGDKNNLREQMREPPGGFSIVQRQGLLNVVGLFGTCGNSHWRDPVMQRFDAAGIKYFNPVVKDWTPACAENEAKNLAADKVLLFVVTDETEAQGSLAETGWAALSAKLNGQRVLFVLDDFKNSDGQIDPKHPANQARKLVRAHAERLGVKIFPSLDSAVQEAVAAMKN